MHEEIDKYIEEHSQEVLDAWNKWIKGEHPSFNRLHNQLMFFQGYAFAQIKSLISQSQSEN